jgi:dihydroorotate dehydrogenase (fumarate)
MMDLSTPYLGLTLPHPLLPGASPMVDDIGTVERLAEAGAPAIVMHSLFEEQIVRERSRTLHDFEAHEDAHAEASAYFPRPEDFALGPSAYLEQIRRIRAATGLPVIASLNGVTDSGWLEYAALIEEAGAAALELNVYRVAADPDEPGTAVEARILEILRAVKRRVTIPVAVKLSPFFSSFAHFARELTRAGADGLVLFNRFYQPDIDEESLEVVPRLELSTSSELLLRLRWLAILSGHVGGTLAASGGVHCAADAIKAVMAGAHGVQMVSALLRGGPGRLRVVLEGMRAWMEEHEYESIDQMRGSMSLLRCPDPATFERANYMRVLQSFR